ncbi:S-layer homology domain-containing protein [Cohnella abietis]|uniref:SLH domain-containing protein n=1 Tax=Cohnella abietis TaxID=2507935 RepID=A0A3T1D577_9BACL|nr:S-layer homology domain-containing protein [Cohnella abietis]BBI33263.1 hypothetical protein KCTCHS21_26620 [Cohnella abietis]
MNTLSKGICGLLVASLIGTGVAWTTSPVSAASPFTDVKAGHWADKHITKLALQGILKGGTGSAAGTFSPGKAVSRQEAVIIALRFMGVANEIKTTDVLVFPSDMVIKEDYKPYIKLALLKKILVIDEEVELAKKEKGKEWGSSPATREWMAKLLVRAIGKDADAKLLADKATSFGDDAKIDTKLKGYVNVAVSSKLVTGVTATKFDPLAIVTRETASTLFSRAESQISVTYPGQIFGTLLSSSASKISLMLADGTAKDYNLSPTASIYSFNSDLTTAITNLKQYGEVTLLPNSDGSIGYVEQTNETPKVKTVEGTLSLVVKSKSRLTLSVGGVDEDYFYDPQRAPTITDANGQALTLDNIPVNVPVKLTIDAFRPDGKIISITVTQSVSNKTGIGTVAAWDVANRKLQVKDSSSDKVDSLNVAANATIKYNNVNQTFDQLKVGDAISYEVKTGVVTSIVVTKTEQPTITGTLDAVIKSNNSIQYTVNNNLEVKRLADSYTVKIEGYSDVTIDDVVKGDTITLTLNDAGKVTKITVLNRSVNTLYSATVISYVAKAKTLIVNDSAGVKHNFNITPTTRFDLNGTVLSLESATSFISTEGKRISVGFSGDNAVFVSVIAKYTGTVLENNIQAKTIKLSLDSSNSITVPYIFPSVEIYGQTSKTYTDIKVGDVVTLQLGNNTQDQATGILLHKTVQLEVVSVDALGNRLGIKRSDGIVESWQINASTVLQDDNGATINLNSIAVGSVVNVSFQGLTAVKIKTVPVTIGKVTTVNAAAGSLDIASSTGSVSTKVIGTNVTIIRDNNKHTSLSVIQPEDRVEIRKDETDRTVIEVITPVKKPVLKFDTVSQLLYINEKATNATVYTSYSLHPKVNIHQGTKTLTTDDLNYGDSLTLYILRGTIIEIIK